MDPIVIHVIETTRSAGAKYRDTREALRTALAVGQWKLARAFMNAALHIRRRRGWQHGPL